jgi:dipeptidyl-peptidase-4
MLKLLFMFRFTFLFVALIGIIRVSSAQHDVRALTLNDVIAFGAYYARTISGLESMNDGEHYTSIVDNNIIKYSYKTGLL